MRPVLLVAVLALLLVACTEEERAGVLLPVEEREPAPEVSGETLEGEELALSDLEGPVLVNFWGSWCGPCVDEAPDLRRLHEHYADQGVAFLGVNVRDSEQGAQRFVEEQDKRFPSLFDPPGEIAAAFGGIGPQAMPSTLLLDDEQRVAIRMFGAVSYGQVQQHLEPLVAEARGEVDDAAEAAR